MDDFPTVRQGARIRLWDGQTGVVVLVVPGSSGGVARVRLDDDGERDVAAEHIAEVFPDQ